jgi:GH24 family phage-related lysozyme (muramidase)
MYLDTQGNVTIGIGHLIPSAAAARLLSLVTNEGNNAASSEAKAAEWTTIHDKPTGHSASYYRQFTTLHIEQAEIDSLLLHDMETAESTLPNKFNGYSGFPASAKEGLIDMIFNIGATRFNATKWPNFFAAVNANPPDWTTAANESNRPQVSDDRNLEVRNLFLSASHGK